MGLQKVYDAVGRELFWVVLARFGVPDKVLAVLRQFHKGFVVRVRTDDSNPSEWFDVTQGLRHGCVMSPLGLFLSFAAIIHAVQVCFSDHPAICEGLGSPRRKPRVERCQD